MGHGPGFDYIYISRAKADLWLVEHVYRWPRCKMHKIVSRFVCVAVRFLANVIKQNWIDPSFNVSHVHPTLKNIFLSLLLHVLENSFSLLCLFCHSTFCLILSFTCLEACLFVRYEFLCLTIHPPRPSSLFFTRTSPLSVLSPFLSYSVSLLHGSLSSWQMSLCGGYWSSFTPHLNVSLHLTQFHFDLLFEPEGGGCSPVFSQTVWGERHGEY